MIKKIVLYLIIILALAIAFLGGIIFISFSPFSLTIQKPEKDFLIKVVRKVEGLIYHEATIHNPPGDMVPDQLDDRLKQEIKERIN
jgi:hypothetical protein